MLSDERRDSERWQHAHNIVKSNRFAGGYTTYTKGKIHRVTSERKLRRVRAALSRIVYMTLKYA